jgi:hypothetical protein
MKGELPLRVRKRRKNVPHRVQWVAGVLLPPGLEMKNGTWGPRLAWLG